MIPCVQAERLIDRAPFEHWNTQTFIAALRCDRLDAPWVLPGAMNRRRFETYVEAQLAPALGKGDVVILDNLSSHKSPSAAEIAGLWAKTTVRLADEEMNAVIDALFQATTGT